MSTQTIFGIVIVLLLIGGGAYMFTQQSVDDAGVMEKNDEVMIKEDVMIKDDESIMKEDGDAMMEKKAGTYEAYTPEKLALAETGDVVLFFRASWCPTCRTLDADIKKNSAQIPTGTHILDVNYDTATALKQKHGVTYQHALVQVDAQGNQIAKWQGSPTLASLLTNLK